MIQYRAFRNTDPPQLAELWRNQLDQRGLMQPMSVAVLERYVYSKPIFDRLGLVVAVEADRILGFAHAGFGPNADGSTLSTTRGVISMLMLRSEVEACVAEELLKRCEQYLRDGGAREVYGGGNFPLSPFYIGLYGGSEPSGILAGSESAQAVFSGGGYRQARRSLVLHRDLSSFRPLVDRQQMQLRRHTRIEAVVDPPATSWWDAVMFEPFERTRNTLIPRDSAQPAATVEFWNMETMIGAWGVHAVGIVGLEVNNAERRHGMATYLIGESLRQLHTQGYTLAEVHVPETNAAGLALFRRLGFEQVDTSIVYHKLLDPAEAQDAPVPDADFSLNYRRV